MGSLSQKIFFFHLNPLSPHFLPPPASNHRVRGWLGQISPPPNGGYEKSYKNYQFFKKRVKELFWKTFLRVHSNYLADWGPPSQTTAPEVEEADPGNVMQVRV